MKLQIIALMLLGIVSTPIFATNCAVNIEGNDAMRFNKSTIEIPKTCPSFTINLANTGSMPASVMGHNVVISAKSDEQAVINDGATAGLADNYVKPDDKRVIASTKMIGGGEKTSTTFKVSDLKDEVPYVFYCTSPGHASLMHGTIVLK